MNIKDVATLAARLRAEQKTRTNRLENMVFVKSLIENDSNDYLAALLYNLSIPNPPKKPKNDLDYVALAIPNNDDRHYLNFIYADSEIMVGSNGSRMHFVKSTKIGFFDKAYQEVNIDLVYPNVKSIISSIGKLKICYDEFIETVAINAKGSLKPHLFNGSGYNVDYVKDALSGLDLDKTIVSYSTDMLTPIMFSDNNRSAIISPIRINK